MKPEDRYRLIVEYLKEEPEGTSVDVLNRDFVDWYEKATGTRVGIQMYGANKCPQLGRDLAQMKKDYTLTRARTGIQGMAGMGFPTWVWSYRLNKNRYTPY